MPGVIGCCVCLFFVKFRLNSMQSANNSNAFEFWAVNLKMLCKMWCNLILLLLLLLLLNVLQWLL